MVHFEVAGSKGFLANILKKNKWVDILERMEQFDTLFEEISPNFKLH